MRLILALLTICLFNLFFVANGDGECETEDDLDFETCDLKHLKDNVLRDICNRIGLDMEEHVLAFLYDEEEGEQSIDEGGTTTRTYTHEDFVKGAEECLMIEDEMDQLEEDDPDYLAQLERDALESDPEVVAEIVADVLKQDSALLKDIASKLTTDAPEIVKEMEAMMEEGEKLEDRPDIVGYIIADLLAEDPDLDILDEFDEALSSYFFEDWGDESEGGVLEGGEVGDGDEL
jgi:hypothetical protein